MRLLTVPAVRERLGPHAPPDTVLGFLCGQAGNPLPRYYAHNVAFQHGWRLGLEYRRDWSPLAVASERAQRTSVLWLIFGSAAVFYGGVAILVWWGWR